MTQALLQVNQLKIAFGHGSESKQVVKGVSFYVNPGECVGLIGESGSGKTISMKTLLGAPGESFHYRADAMVFDGQDLLTLDDKAWRYLRGSAIAYIPQNPADALTPHQTIGGQFKELSRIHQLKLGQADFLAALGEVGLTHAEAVLSMYPHQLSGGMAQRVAIAMSLLAKPKLLIADEPTSAIDASLKETVLKLIKTIVESHGLSLLIITHDFEVVESLCQRAYVMHRGQFLEEGDVSELLFSPQQPYTAGLVACYRSLQSTDPEFYQMPNWQQAAASEEETAP